MNRTVKVVLTVLGVLALVVMVWYLRAIFVYLLVAAVLTLIGRPLTDLLNRIHIGKVRMPPSVSALITLLVYIAVFSGFVSLFIPLILEEIRILSQIEIDEVINSLQEPLKGFEEWLEKNRLVDNISLPEMIRRDLAGVIEIGSLPSLFGSFIGKLGSIFITFFSIFFMTFFFLKDEGMIRRMVLSVTPSGREENAKKILYNTKKVLTRYFVGILVQIISVTIVVGAGLSLLGIENAIVIGFIAGVINIVPYLGPIMGAIVGIIVGVTTNLDLDFYSEMLPLCGKILLVFLIVQMMDNFLLQPLIFSRSAKAHPLEIFLVILIGASVGGIFGMICAIPVYIFIRIFAKEFLSEFKIVKTLTSDL